MIGYDPLEELAYIRGYPPLSEPRRSSKGLLGLTLIVTGIVLAGNSIIDRCERAARIAHTPILRTEDA